MSEFWEPWVPEKGQLVRYRKNPECPVRHLSPDKDGALGIVSSIHNDGADSFSLAGHYYYVTDNRWYWPHEWKHLDGMFCAAELEPVDESERPPLQARYPRKWPLPKDARNYA